MHFSIDIVSGTSIEIPNIQGGQIIFQFLPITHPKCIILHCEHALSVIRHYTCITHYPHCVRRSHASGELKRYTYMYMCPCPLCKFCPIPPRTSCRRWHPEQAYMHMCMFLKPYKTQDKTRNLSDLKLGKCLHFIYCHTCTCILYMHYWACYFFRSFVSVPFSNYFFSVTFFLLFFPLQSHTCNACRITLVRIAYVLNIRGFDLIHVAWHIVYAWTSKCFHEFQSFASRYCEHNGRDVLRGL